MASKVSPWLAARLVALVLTVTAGGGAIYVANKPVEVPDAALEQAQRDPYVQAVAADASTSQAVKIAMVMGWYFESSGRHIGTPYVDNLGKGRPLTVCNGITGSEVVSGKWYSPAECYSMERARYVKAEQQAIGLLASWPRYDPFVRASFIDFLHNKGMGNFMTSTMLRKANAGDLQGACRENPRWNRGTVNGVSTVLPGLQGRGDANAEFCSAWRLQ